MTLHRLLVRLAIFLLIPLSLGISTYAWLKHNVISPAQSGNTSSVLIALSPGKSFRALCQELEQQQVIVNWRSLYYLARFKGVDTEIKAGEYELSPSMQPKEILRKLLSGEIFRRAIIFKEGALLRDLPALVEAAGLLPAAEFKEAVSDRELSALAGVTEALSLEGYLFPDTYLFSRPVSPRQIIERMISEANKHWTSEFAGRARELNLSRHEVLTLASIIEKESGNVEEQPLVASVFHNRLSKGMKLQSDPTVIYGIENFDGNLKKIDLITPHSYNTYTNFGLPPGPIANPGLSAIRAALFPANTRYLYFVGNGQGRHVFSESLEEHNDAVARYQLGRRSTGE